MNYLEFVVAAYAVFVVVMAYEFVAPRLQIKRAQRAARQQAARTAPRAGINPNELTR